MGLIKELPNKLSKELFLKLDYINCRLMGSKEVLFRTRYNPSNLFTAKISEGASDISEKELLHLHIRFEIGDKFYGTYDNLDIDLYIPKSEAIKLKEII